MNLKIIITSLLFFTISCSTQQKEDSNLKTPSSSKDKTENNSEELNKDSIEFDIDKRFNDCIEENSCTVCFEECSVRAIKDWRAEMNKYYTLLLDSLDKPSKEKLILSQTKWLEFSELELQFSNEFYGNMDGTIWNGVSLSQSKEKIKSRAINLKAHYNAITGDAIRGK
jgi:uncharacterized protein YecT (DUF1311 family)